MSDESHLQVTRKDAESSLVLSSARSSLVARGRREAATLTAPVEAEPEEYRSGTCYFSDFWGFATRPIEQLRDDAEKGDAKQQSLLAYAYRHGPGEHDLAESTRWYRKAADQGNAYAQNTLGLIYDKGEGVAQDYVEAAKWYSEAAHQGYAPAQFNLGVMYDTGEGVAQDYVEAIKWYRKAADQGRQEREACFNLGVKYDNGQGVAQNFTEAVRWYRKAAYQGWDAALFNLGHAYANGRGVPKDYALAHMYYNFSIPHGSREDQERRAKARDDVAKKLTPQQLADAQQMDGEWHDVHWYRRSAERGDALAQVNLGVAYYKGQGVPQDYEEGVKWLYRAAKQWNAIAQSILGAAHEKGEGVPQDYVQAHMWINLAASASMGDNQGMYSSARDAVAAKMTPQQIADAQRLAREWKSANAK